MERELLCRQGEFKTWSIETAIGLGGKKREKKDLWYFHT